MSDVTGLMQPGSVAMLVSAAVFLLVLLVLKTMLAQGAIRRRVGAPLAPTVRSPIEAAEVSEHGEALRWLMRTGGLFAPHDRMALVQVRKQLIQAGFFSAAALPVYYASRVLLALALPLLAILLSGFLPFGVPAVLTFIAAAWIAVTGVIVPAVFVDWRRSKMQVDYRHAFPDFMDLLVVCIEAGQSLQGALDRVSREVVPYSPALAVNLRLACLELRAGARLTDAIEALHARLGIEEVNSLGLLLKQSEELGTSIADSLRVFSDEMRDKRLMRAETKAHALPVKMTIPLGFFIFPVILMVIMLPVIIRIRIAFV